MGCHTPLCWMLPICCDKFPQKENTLRCTHIKQIYKWRMYLQLLMSRTISTKNTFNMHIMTVLMHFRSINQVLKYKARITSLNRKTELKALKTCAPSDSIPHKLISSYNHHCVSVICLINSPKISLVKTKFIFHCLIQQGTSLYHP